MEIIATFPLPDGSEIAVYRDGASYRVTDHETPERWPPLIRSSAREACALADMIANRYRYPNAQAVGAP